MVEMPRLRSIAGALLCCLASSQAACAQEPVAPPPTPYEVEVSAYPWIDEGAGPLPPLTPLRAAFPAPEGAERVPVISSSFAAWLRGLPVRTDRTHALSHEGRPLAAHSAGVVLLDLGTGDLQQCADTLIRLHAEYLWFSGRAATAAYHFTSGDLSTWADWVGGVRWAPRGRGVEKVPGAPRSDDHSSYRLWLQRLFVYAGTMSMALDSEPVSSGDAIRPGDFFVAPGSPGHTVMVLDVATTADGARLGLIGQGFTPAQELHIIEDSAASIAGNVWFPLPDRADESLVVPTWSPFPRSTARRFSGPPA